MGKKYKKCDLNLSPKGQRDSFTIRLTFGIAIILTFYMYMQYKEHKVEGGSSPLNLC